MGKIVRKTVLILLLFLAFTSSAFAAEVGEKSKEVNINDEFEFVVKFDEKVIAANFEIEYDPDKVQLQKSTDETIQTNKIENGKEVVLYSDKTGTGADQVKLKFKALTTADKTIVNANDFVGYSTASQKEISMNNTGNEMSLKINATQGGNPSQSPTPKPSQSSGSGQTSSGQGDKTGAQSKYPYTGKQIVQIGFITILGISIIISIIKNKKIGKLSVIIFAVLIGTNLTTGEVKGLVAKSYAKTKNLEKIVVVVPDKINRTITYEKFLQTVEIDSKIQSATSAEKTLESNQLVTTGTRLKLENGKTYSVVLYGDVNQDGKINATDVGKIIEHTLKKETLTGVSLKAANLANKDDQEDRTIDINDITRLERYILQNTTEQIVEELPTYVEPDPEIDLTCIVTKNAIQVKVIGENLEEGATYSYYIRKQEGENAYKLKQTTTATTYTFEELSSNTNYLIKVEYKDSKNKEFTKEKTVKTSKVDVTGITLDKDDETIDIGTTLTIKPTITPADASVKDVTWSSSNNGVATVENGVVTGKTVGVAKITATTVDGNKTATCTVHVKLPYVPVTSVELDRTTAVIETGTTTKLIPIVKPDNATIKDVTWQSDNTEVATVAADGTVTAVKAGTAKITVTTEAENKTATCTITVKDEIIHVTGITLDKTTANLKTEETLQLTPTITPNEAENKTIIWTTSDESKATVSHTGLVTAKGNGTVDIKAKTEDKGFEAKCTITITTDVKSVSLNKTTATIHMKGQPLQLTAEVSPSTASDKSIRWSSSDSTVAEVSTTGLVTAKKIGTATITAESHNGKKATCEITVEKEVIEVSSISLNRTSETLTLNGVDRIQLTANVLPANATNKEITWTSSNENVAVVTEEGMVVAVKKGTTVITAKSNNEKTATCSITVVEGVASVDVSPATASIQVGNQKQLTATVSPSTAQDKSITWESNDTSVATVSTSGIVTAKSVGTAEIIARSATNKTGRCTVTVTASTTNIDVTSLKMKESTIVLDLSDEDTHKLEVEFKPTNATNRDVTWRSSNPAVATVSEDGTVTAVANGEAIITAVSHNNKKTTCTVSVITSARKIELDPKSVNVPLGRKVQISYEFTPKVVTSSYLTWTSSDPAVAEVTNKGIVTAKKIGTTTITATTTNGKYSSCTVKVIEATSGILLNRTSITIDVNGEDEEGGRYFSLKPLEIIDEYITWTSQNPAIASVNKSGRVTAMSNGDTVITASINGVTQATCAVKVVTGAEYVTVSPTSGELAVGKTRKITATIYPNSVTDKSIRWISSDERKATVSSDGTVTGVSAGKVTITAKCANGKSATCSINVFVEVTGVKLNKSSLSFDMSTNKTPVQLTETVLPTNATNKYVTWASDKTSVATVKNGLVTPTGNGSATITVKTADNKYSASCTVNVKTSVTKVKLNYVDLYLFTTGDQSTRPRAKQITASIEPSSASDRTITYTNTNSKVATVSSNGYVTAVKTGTTVVTATAHNGVKATCTVHVNDPNAPVGSSPNIFANMVDEISGTQYNLMYSNTTEDLIMIPFYSAEIEDYTPTVEGAILANQGFIKQGYNMVGYSHQVAEETFEDEDNKRYGALIELYNRTEEPITISLIGATSTETEDEDPLSYWDLESVTENINNRYQEKTIEYQRVSDELTVTEIITCGGENNATITIEPHESIWFFDTDFVDTTTLTDKNVLAQNLLIYSETDNEYGQEDYTCPGLVVSEYVYKSYTDIEDERVLQDASPINRYTETNNMLRSLCWDIDIGCSEYTYNIFK